MLASTTAADEDDVRAQDRETCARNPGDIPTDPESSGLDGGSDVLG